MSSFVFLVSASLTSCFGFLLSSYGRFFIKFLLSKIADDTVAGAFSLETTQRAFYVFVFTNSYCGHSFSPSFAYAFIDYYAIIAIPPFYVKSFFGVFATFLRNFPFYTAKGCRRVKFLVERLSVNQFTFSKSDAGCLHQGQMKSSGSSSPSCT